MSLVVPLPTSKYSQEIAYIFKEDEDDDDQSLQSPMQQEKQISADPISLQRSMKYESQLPLFLPPLPPSKHKFISANLPGSTTASPLSSGLQPHTKKNVKKWRNHQAQASPPLPINPLYRQQSLGRCKSFGEGRASAPSDEFDIFSRKLSSPKHHERIEKDDDGNEDVSGKIKAKDHNPESNKEDNFKCGSCLFMPAFGRGKPVRARKEEAVAVERNVISITDSLEKFECESWSSSAIMYEDDEERKSMHLHLYIDLPLEVIENCGNDMNSPKWRSNYQELNIKNSTKEGTS